MTRASEQFPYVDTDLAAGPSSRMPILPLTVSLGGISSPVMGLVDSGSAVNVLPRSVGEGFGLDWERQSARLCLGGSLAGVEARGIVLSARVGRFPDVKLAFAWADTDAVPVVLGQMNFFLEFDVCLFRSREVFEVRPK